MQRHLSLLLLLLPSLLLTVSCGKQSDTGADDLLSEARAAVDSRQWAAADSLTALLDSLYPSAVDQRRQAMTLRAAAQEGQAVAALAATDSLATLLQLRADSLQRRMRRIDTGVGVCLVPADADASSPLQVRIDPDNGLLTLVARLSGSKSRFTALTLTAPDGRRASTPSYPVDGELNEVSGGVQTLTVSGAAADSLAALCAACPSGPLTLSYDGAARTATLSARAVKPLAQAAELAQARAALRRTLLDHQRLERVLEAARRHRAITAPDPEP